MAALGAEGWLAGDVCHDRRPVAVDGKAVRGTRHASGNRQGRHLLAAADQQAGAVLAQAEVDGKTNEITAFAPLLAPLDLAGTVVTADALHAQREHAEFLVTKKGAHYILAQGQPALPARSAQESVLARDPGRLRHAGEKATAAPSGAP